MNGSDRKRSTPETPCSSRMEEALRLRQALQDSVSCLNRKHLISELVSPKTADGMEKENQFDDIDEDEYDPDFEVASIRGEGSRAGENDEPIGGAERYSSRAAILARLEVKPPGHELVNSTGAGTGSISSKVFKNQLSARFKSTTQPARRMASTDSNEGGQN